MLDLIKGQERILMNPKFGKFIETTEDFNLNGEISFASEVLEKAKQVILDKNTHQLRFHYIKYIN